MRIQPRLDTVRRSSYSLDTPLHRAENLLRLLVVLVLVLGFSVSMGQRGFAQDAPPNDSSGTPIPGATESPVQTIVGDLTTDLTDPPAELTATATVPSESTEDPNGGTAPADPSLSEDSGTPPSNSPAATATKSASADAEGDFEVAAVGAVTILKLNCTATIDLSEVSIVGILAGTADPATLGCQLATGVTITATDPITGLTLGSATTANGVAVIDGLTLGSQVTLTEAVPVGYEPQGSSSRTITVNPANVQLFVNVAVSGSPLAALIVIKLNCDAAIDLASLDLGAIIAGTVDLLSLGCQLASNVAIAVTDPLTGSTLAAGNTLNGLVTFTGLPADAGVLVNEEAVAGFTAQNPGPHQVTLLPGQNLDIFVNINNNAGVTTDVGVTKLNCPASVALDPTDVLTGVLDQADLLGLGCVLADGVPFSVTNPISGASLDAGVTVDGVFTASDLAVGATVRISETVPAGFTAITPAQDLLVAPGATALFINQEIPPTGSVTIDTVDANGAPLTGACYTIETAGGTVVDTACDGDDASSDGTTVVTDLAPGSYVAVQSTPPTGYDTAVATPFTITAAEPDASITVTNTTGPGSITITTVDPDGNPLDGTCYEAQSLGGEVIGSACDTDNDGATVIDDLPLGPYDVVQTTPPAGYDPSDTVPVTLTIAEPDVAITVTNDSGPGTITIETVDANGNPLTDACYAVQTAGGTTLATVCDDDDGASDGTTSIEDLPLETFAVVQVTPPAGYQAADPATATLTIAEPDASLVITNNLGEGSVTVETVDDNGFPLPGACYDLQTSGGTVVGTACDNDGGPNDGTTTIPNVPPGSYDVVQTMPPGGYEPADPTLVDVTTVELDPTVTVTNGTGAGSVTIDTIDPNGNALVDACYEIRTAGGTPVGKACDSTDGTVDGTTVINELTPGAYVAVQTTTPGGEDPAADTPFTITPEEPDVAITVVNGAAVGSVTILTVDADGNPLDDACYQIRTTRNSVIATACDATDGTVDGTVVIDGLPIGSYTAIQVTAPDGFDPAPNTPFAITKADPDVTLTVTNDSGSGSITIETVDANGAPLDGACYRIETAGGAEIATACDADDGTADGTTTVDDLPLGTYVIEQTTAPVGYQIADPGTATLTTADPDATVTMTNDLGAGLVTIETVDSDGNPLPGACYQVQIDTNVIAGPVCDADDGTDDGTTVIENLPPGDYVAVETTAPEGYTPGDDAPFAVTPEDLDPEVTVTNDAGPGSITIDTVNGDGNALTGACYEAQTAVGTVIGFACDSDDGSDDGTTVIDDLPIRAYDVVQSTAPAGYAPATDVPVTLTIADPDAAITVTNTVGLGSVTITTVNEDHAPLPGACYEIRTTGGILAGTGCDDDGGTADGITVIDGLAPGSYAAVEMIVPTGYLAADSAPFSITADDLEVELTIVNQAALGSVTIDTQDTDGNPIEGACYVAQPASGAAVGPICDADDGSSDGTTVLDDLPLGTVEITQTTAPDGFDPADPISVSLTSHEPDVTVTVTNSESAGDPSGTVRVIVIDERNHALPGVCVRLDAMMTTAAVSPNGTICDGDDGSADGVIVVTDLPLATYTVTVISVPAGYSIPAPINVTLSEPGQVASITIVVPGPGTDDGNAGTGGKSPTSLPKTGSGAVPDSSTERNLLLFTAVLLMLLAIAARPMRLLRRHTRN